MSDAYVVVGALALILGLVAIHPALLLVAVGVLAIRHGQNRE